MKPRSLVSRSVLRGHLPGMPARGGRYSATPSRPLTGGIGSPARRSLMLPPIYAALKERGTPRNSGRPSGGERESAAPGAWRPARVSQPEKTASKAAAPGETTAQTAQHPAAARSKDEEVIAGSTRILVPSRTMRLWRPDSQGMVNDPQQGTPCCRSHLLSQASEINLSCAPGSFVSRRIRPRAFCERMQRSSARPPSHGLWE